MAATTVLCVLTVAFDSRLSLWLPLPLGWLVLVPLTAGTRNLGEAILVHLQAIRRPKPFIALQLVQTLTNLALSLLFVVALTMNWQGRVLAQVLAPTLLAAVAIAFLRPWRLLKFEVPKSELTRVLKYGLPLVPQYLVLSALFLSDRYLVTAFSGLKMAGIYSVAYQLGQVVNMVDLSVGKAWLPWMFERLTRQNGLREIKQSLCLYAALLTVTALAVTTIAHGLQGFLLGQRFTAALPFVIWLSLAFAFNGMADALQSFFHYFEKTRWLWVPTAVCATIHISAVCLFIPQFGAIAAAWSACGTAVLRMLWFLPSCLRLLNKSLHVSA